MLARRATLFLAPTVLFFLIVAFYHFPSFKLTDPPFTKGNPASTKDDGNNKPASKVAVEPLPASSSKDAEPEQPNLPVYTPIPVPSTHHELRSLSTPDKSYFAVSFGPDQDGALNPNIIPHPTDDSLYAIVASETPRGGFDFHSIACYASFNTTSDSADHHPLLSCLEPALNLPIAPTKGLPCPGKFSPLDLNAGPHDIRVFWGPDSPYAVYGSNSRYSCFGQFIQKFPPLMGWTADMVAAAGRTTPTQKEMDRTEELASMFRSGTEMQRPGPHGQIEKNWFVFWDAEGQMYAHYEISPTRRSFAAITGEGSVVGGSGGDLALLAAERDGSCLVRYVPLVEHTSVHQATNSLAVTLCRRADSSCIPDEENTVVITVFHRKTSRWFHSEYEPYVMAFGQKAPFEMYGVSKKPLWIKGRGQRDDGVTEMMFVTSITWKDRGLRYRGYLDDVVFVGFGIEDRRTGGIDVRAEDLLVDLGFCEGG